ncbi:hypothetical protein [Pleionea sediminis]|uniref:hypothetical protein n=1 Tax=Pleionea sediminis TaxID=2569479 RepID=UPI0011867B75|nr:hypothetical protein [Pleionea sediminis]
MIQNYLLYIWLAVFIGNHLLFKYVVLNKLKKQHHKVWVEIGEPTIFSSKESLWSLVGLTGDHNVGQLLKREDNSEKSLVLLNRYKWSTCLEFALLFATLGSFIYASNT